MRRDAVIARLAPALGGHGLRLAVLFGSGARTPWVIIAPVHRIRDAQWRALRDTARDDFVERMHAHLQQHFPAQVAAMGRSAALDHIRRTIEIARTFDLVSRRDVCKYLNLTMVHGLLFHRDPERAWMLAMLRDPAVPDPRERLARLYAEAVRRMEIDAKNARIREEFGL